jgi:restriction endonuclease
MNHCSTYQTHFSPDEEDAFEQEDVKKLVNVVEDSLEQIAKITKLPLQEVMHVIEEVDVEQLQRATREAVKNIAQATDLDSAKITSIFREDRAATIDHIIRRLREESHVCRAKW